MSLDLNTASPAGLHSITGLARHGVDRRRSGTLADFGQAIEPAWNLIKTGGPDRRRSGPSVTRFFRNIAGSCIAQRSGATFGADAQIEHNRTLYKQRNRIERMFGRPKINRAIATRYEQITANFMRMVHIATARYWLKFVYDA